MKIRKVRYAEPDNRNKIDRHCAAFLTRSGDVILVTAMFDKSDNREYPFFNTGDAVRVARDIMKHKAKSLRIAPIIGAIGFESTSYDANLVEMAKSGQLTNAIVIENISDSEEELKRFARDIMTEFNGKPELRA